MTLSRLFASTWLASTALAAASLVSRAAGAETLTAEQAVRRAASQNPTLRAALLDVASARHAALAEDAARDPTLVASVTGEYSESFGKDTASASRSASESLKSSVALRYTTDIGTSLEAGVSADAAKRVGGGAGSLDLAGPSYTGLAYVTARQPLLRGAGKDAVLAPFVQAQAAETVAERQRELTASQTALDVLGAYWELWYAEHVVSVQEEALSTANRQLEDAKTRAATLGTASRVDVLQFSTAAASIEDALSQARATRATRAIELGRLLAVDPAAAIELHASGAPPSLGALPSTEAVTRAVTERSQELAALRAELTSSRARVTTAEDADQPRLDVFATVSAGALWSKDDVGSFGLAGGRPAYSIVGGLELELPIGGRGPSDVGRAKTQLAAAEARYEARADALAAQASGLRVNLQAAGEQVALATRTAKNAAELADAERQRLELGTASSSDVVKAEQTRRESELRKLRAEVAQATSRFQLEHATGALLDRVGSSGLGRSS